MYFWYDKLHSDIYCSFNIFPIVQENEDEGAVSAKDIPIMMGMLESIIILWEGSGKIFKVTCRIAMFSLMCSYHRGL